MEIKEKDKYSIDIHNCYSCQNFDEEHQLCCWEWDDPEKIENPEAPICWHWNEEPWYS